MSHPPPPQLVDTPFVNELRLGVAHWVAVFSLVALVMLLTPPIWKQVESFDPGPDYRIPYALSKDYWLYARRLEQLGDPQQVIVLGDSVIWGEYVLPDGTLSHFLNRSTGTRDRFINGGVNGLYPLALEGLVQHYGGALRGRKILLHCNLLWLSSPKADLQDGKEDNFNHPHLVPQFFPRIPSYQADAAERLSAIVEREVGFLSWADHLQAAYFGERNIASWTLFSDGGDPPRHPNAYKNPLAQLTLAVPSAPPNDSKRGPGSRRHRPWTATSEGAMRFEWVALDRSLQWAGFQRLLHLLRERGNDVWVVVGPFNEHLMTDESRAAYRKLRDGVVTWLTAQHFAHVAPEPLPSALYADASHPLTAGYQLLAERLRQSEKLAGTEWGRGDPPVNVTTVGVGR